MKRFFLISLAIALAMGVSAQESATVISADRPGMATGVDVMPFKSVQWETGFQYDYSSGAHSITLPTTLFRLGIIRFAELRMEYDGTLASADKKQWEYAVEPLVVGTKIKVFEGTENEKLQWLPAVSFLLNLAIPSTPDLANTTHVAPPLTYCSTTMQPIGSASITTSVQSGTAYLPNRRPSSHFVSASVSPTMQARSSRVTTTSPTMAGDPAALPMWTSDLPIWYNRAYSWMSMGPSTAKTPASSANVGLGVAWMIN